MTSINGEFAQKQAEAARIQQARLEQAQAFESRKAAGYLGSFVAEAAAKGLEPETLVVTGYGGKGSAKSNLRGWYLKADRTLGVDTNGNYYILITDLPPFARFRTVSIDPSPPPLILSKGGRDGESMDLTAKLDELLPTWREAGRGPLTDTNNGVGR